MWNHISNKHNNYDGSTGDVHIDSKAYLCSNDDHEKRNENVSCSDRDSDDIHFGF